MRAPAAAAFRLTDVAQRAAPALEAEALPGLGAVAVEAAREGLALGAVGAPPAQATATPVGLLAETVGRPTLHAALS